MQRRPAQPSVTRRRLRARHQQPITARSLSVSFACIRFARGVRDLLGAGDQRRQQLAPGRGLLAVAAAADAPGPRAETRYRPPMPARARTQISTRASRLTCSSPPTGLPEHERAHLLAHERRTPWRSSSGGRRPCTPARIVTAPQISTVAERIYDSVCRAIAHCCSSSGIQNCGFHRRFERDLLALPDADVETAGQRRSSSLDTTRAS